MPALLLWRGVSRRRGPVQGMGQRRSWHEPARPL